MYILWCTVLKYTVLYTSGALYIKIYDGAGGVLYIVLFSNVCIVLLHQFCTVFYCSNEGDVLDCDSGTLMYTSDVQYVYLVLSISVCIVCNVHYSVLNNDTDTMMYTGDVM